MSKVLLDASAVLCLLHQESGAEHVERILNHAAVSTVNVAEVHSKLCEANMPNEEISNIFPDLGISIIDFGQVMAHQTGQLVTSTD